MARADVKYKQVYKCKVCDEKVSFPKEVWESWTDAQRQMFLDEQARSHLVHPEE